MNHCSLGFNSKKCWMMRQVAATSESASSKFLGVLAVVRAMLYCSQGHPEKITSGAGSALKSHVSTSATTVAPWRPSRSTRWHSQPAAAKGAQIEPVPSKRLNSLILGDARLEWALDHGCALRLHVGGI